MVKVFSLNNWSNILVTKAGTEEVCTGKKWFNFVMSLRYLQEKFQVGNIILNLLFNTCS